ncbi:hypothetical protein J3A83DRAFT_4189967 [Scleroderma citrinum]
MPSSEFFRICVISLSGESVKIELSKEDMLGKLLRSGQCHHPAQTDSRRKYEKYGNKIETEDDDDNEEGGSKKKGQEDRDVDVEDGEERKITTTMGSSRQHRMMKVKTRKRRKRNS